MLFFHVSIAVMVLIGPNYSFIPFKTKDNFFESILNTTATSACNINLVVIGAVGSGKSSLVNTMKTVFRDSEEISTIASVYGIEHGSITKKVF